MSTRRVVVRGQVQGVGFRYFARAEAQRLGVVGWVRNRLDGAVEAQIDGEEHQLTAMLRWLSHGPPTAVVSSIESSEFTNGELESGPGGSSFRIVE